MRLFWFCAQKPIRFTSFRLQFPGASGPNAARVYDSKMGALGESDEEDPDDAECARPVASLCASLALCICMVGMGERVNASGVQTVFRFSGGRRCFVCDGPENQGARMGCRLFFRESFWCLIFFLCVQICTRLEWR